MKINKVLEMVDYTLTDETKKDNKLNPIDLNILAILQYIKDGKNTYKDGYFNIILKDGPTIKTSVQGVLSELGIDCNYTTVSISINKLWRMGYIDYKRGYYNNDKQKGCWPKIKILKGTIDIKSCESDECDTLDNNDSSLSNCNTEDYSVIAIAQENYKDKENYKEKNKEKLKRNNKKNDIYEYLSQRSLGSSFELFCQSNPSVETLGIPMDELRLAYDEVKCYGF